MTCKESAKREKNFFTNTIAFLRKRTCSLGQYISSDLGVRTLGWNLNEVSSFLFWGGMNKSAVLCSGF